MKKHRFSFFAFVAVALCLVMCANTVTSYAATGKPADNLYAGEYSRWASVAESYLYEENGTLTRVQYTGEDGKEILIENTDANANVSAVKTLKLELPIFGGFFAGKNYNFIVCGQNNPKQSDSVAVMRVIKYSKNWQRLGDCTLYGENTYIPFDAGSLSMAETDEFLFVHTCHEMYMSSDGYHHQANMTFKINKESMTAASSFSGIMNINWGYVSHSFNQFVRTDGDSVFRVDHGDAYPRAISLTKCSAGGSVTDVSYITPLVIQGNIGANDTGVSIGGFELSEKNCLIAGSTVDQSSAAGYNPFGVRNIFVSVSGKDLSFSRTVYLTDFTSSSGVTVHTPLMLKYDSDTFVIMWRETRTDESDSCTAYAVTDGSGNLKTGVRRTYSLKLSDCQPIVTSDNKITWYAGGNDSIEYYKLSISEENRRRGDVDADGIVTVSDARLALRAAVKLTVLFDSDLSAADVDNSGVVEVSDARLILRAAVKLAELN